MIAKEYDAPSTDNVPQSPDITPDHIWFNGWKDGGHETFVVTREKPDNPSWDKEATTSFDFCKTNRKPYDLAVCLVLLTLKQHAPESVEISSDGEWDVEWLESRKVFKELFGIESQVPWVMAET